MIRTSWLAQSVGRVISRAHGMFDAHAACSIDFVSSPTHQSCTWRIISTGSRFFKTVHVQPAQGDQGFYNVLLDKYPVKTPGKQILSVPSYMLAMAIAAEWEWQPRPRDKVIAQMLKYIHTDAACCRYEGGELASRQAQVFNPLLAWVHSTLGWQLHTASDIAGPTQSDETVELARRCLMGLDQWHLAAAEQLTGASKSLVVALALLHGRITVQEAIKAARLEENYQCEGWGMVEAGHDLDIADYSTRIAAPSLFVRLLQLEQAGAQTKQPSSQA